MPGVFRGYRKREHGVRVVERVYCVRAGQLLCFGRRDAHAVRRRDVQHVVLCRERGRVLRMLSWTVVGAG